MQDFIQKGSRAPQGVLHLPEGDEDTTRQTSFKRRTKVCGP